MEAVMFDSKLVKIDKEIAKEIAKAFKVDIPEVQAMVKEYQELTLIPDDKESYAVCRKGLTACVHFRTGIDTIRLAQNKDDQKRIKGRNANAKNLAELVEPAENHLSGLIKGENTRLDVIKAKEAEKERVIIQSRVDELLEYGKPMPFMELAVLDDEEYDTLLFDVKQDFKAEEERIAEEAEKAEAEKLRLEEIRIEQEAIAEQQAKIAKAQEEAVVKIKAEQKIAQDKIDADRKAIDDEKARIAKELADKQATEIARIQTEQFEKDEAERLAKARVEEEAKRKADKERTERLAPDKELLETYLDGREKELDRVPSPTFATDELLAAFSHINVLLYKAIREGREIIKTA